MLSSGSRPRILLTTFRLLCWWRKSLQLLHTLLTSFDPLWRLLCRPSSKSRHRKPRKKDKLYLRYSETQERWMKRENYCSTTYKRYFAVSSKEKLLKYKVCQEFTTQLPTLEKTSAIVPRQCRTVLELNVGVPTVRDTVKLPLQRSISWYSWKPWDIRWSSWA